MKFKESARPSSEPSQPFASSHAIPQSGMGIASLVLALISLVKIGLLFAVIAVSSATFAPNHREDSPFNYLLGGWVIAIALLAICGIVFGIGGLRQDNRRRSIATIGLCMNIGIPIGVMFLLLLAITINSSAPHTLIASRPHQPEDGSPAWRSPPARALQIATVGMGLLAATYSWNRRRPRFRLTEHSRWISCRTCNKQMPDTSTFCRRCGHALQA